jgi:mono/diheme cytochrome c family protein
MKAALVRAFAAIGVLALLVAVLSVVLCIQMVRRGFSARDEPSMLETKLAEAMRHWGVPTAAARRANPIIPTADALADARDHWADHCAVCHGNDGRGSTVIGSSLYPRAPDMTAHPTQDQTDGELFHAIEEGITLSGMPAWKSADHADETSSWKLVLFIRHLPALTDDELRAMSKMNPKTPDEREEDEFLNGNPSITPHEERKHP